MPATARYDCFAVTAPGIESIVAAELKGLWGGRDEGATRPRVVEGGVEFHAGPELLYGANLHLRAASRVLVRLATFHASTFAELERRAKKVPWDTVVPHGARVRLRVTCRKSRLYHSDGVAERLMNGITSRVRAFPADAPARAVATPDDDAETAQLFVVRLDHDECTISVDSSGAHLHQRGYRKAVTQAPLRETLAAAMLLGSGWDQQSPLLDPFCGSGTIAIEAALLARRAAPGRHRRFRFMEWPDFSASAWKDVAERAAAEELPKSPAEIFASDRSGWAMRAAQGNAERAGVTGDIAFRRADVESLEPPTATPGWLVTNPPYGVRLGSRDELREMYRNFGAVLRERFSGWHLGLLSTDRRLDGLMRVLLLDRFRTTNGGIRVHFLAGRTAPRGRIEPASRAH